MKLILHIGSPKTGTSTLQATFKKNFHTLKSAGYLYPWFKSTNHHTPIVLVSRFNAPPRMFVQNGPVDPAVLKARGVAAITEIKRQIDRHKPHTVILSSEHLFSLKSADEVDTIAQHVESLGGEVEVVCYLRDPVSMFISNLGQYLKTTHELPDLIEPINYAGSLEPYRRRMTLNVHKFGRASLKDGDIVVDFMSRYLRDAPLLQTSDDANITPGAEGMKVMWLYRLAFLASKPRTFDPHAQKMYHKILAIENKLGFPRKIIPCRHVTERIYTSFRSDEDYLKRIFGIEFLNNKLFAERLEPLPPPKCLEDIFEIDQGRFQVLLESVVPDWLSPAPLL